MGVRKIRLRAEQDDLGAVDFLAREFWRFVQVQQKVAELAQTAIEHPPMQHSPPAGTTPAEHRHYHSIHLSPRQ
jgi:hypothetical protein